MRVVYSQTPDKPNFIFIVLDDLNDYVEGFTDHPQVETPNLKSLSAEGTLFLNNFANAPGCAPSRTSFFSGKDLNYTQVYNNSDYESKFRENFTAAKNNEEVFTLPEILKDSGGYYTYAINKLFHNPNENDFDKMVGTPECEKKLSWNKMDYFGDSDSILAIFSEYGFGHYFDWGMIPDSMETKMEDYKAADTAIQFIHNYAADSTITCGNPFFLALGFARPHSERYIPEKYFSDYYLEDIYEEPYIIPYNYPIGNFPFNGIVMPVQPETPYADYYALPGGGVAESMAEMGNVYKEVEDYINSLVSLPEIDPVLTDADREVIIQETIFANYQINYIAAIKFIDAQLGRVMDALNAHPELKENTIIIIVSDNGYSLGEKKHWTKWSLWETDIRVPMIIIDPTKPGNQISEQPVSLLDLFPTVCDMAGVNYPVFSDGSDYLDGKSIVNLLNDPEIIYECPAISTAKKNGSIGSCFPHHSIRNDRFHYIRYRENNDGGFEIDYCDSTTILFEEELYEIGVDRNVDPYEWNNLIYNDYYQPVINYLQQWMPDSTLYLQRTYKPFIENNFIGCFADHEDTLHLSIVLYDTTGTVISPPPGFTYKWTNNLTADVFYGGAIELDLGLISDIDFGENEMLMIYFEMINDSTSITAGFDIKYVYINNSNIPEATFNVLNDLGLTVCIKDYVVSGSFTDSWWDFGDGHISTEYIPGPYTYVLPGTYTITNYLEYGNDSCVNVFTENIFLSNNTADPETQVNYFPNPANNELFITLPDQVDYAALSIFDLTGRLIRSARYMSANCNFSCSVNVSTLKPGIYLFMLQTEDSSYEAPFIIIH